MFSEALRLAQQYGIEKVIIIGMAIALYPVAKGVLNLAKPLLDTWIADKNRLMDELTKSREAQEKFVSNHLAHLQDALVKGQEQMAERITEGDKEMVRALQANADVIRQSISILERMDEHNRLEMQYIRSLLSEMSRPQ